MSQPPKIQRKLPVVLATEKAIKQAAAVVPDAVVENAVRDALIEHGFLHRSRERNVAVVRGPGFEAVLRRAVSPLGSGRKIWEIVEVASCRPKRHEDAT